jgi:hypothetical protein
MARRKCNEVLCLLRNRVLLLVALYTPRLKCVAKISHDEYGLKINSEDEPFYSTLRRAEQISP